MGLLSSPPGPDLFWGSLILLSNGYRGVMLTAHLQLAPRLRMRGAIPPLFRTSSWRGTLVKLRDNFTFTVERNTIHAAFLTELQNVALKMLVQ
jgi:hypothetical protein